MYPVIVQSDVHSLLKQGFLPKRWAKCSSESSFSAIGFLRHFNPF